MIELLAEWRVAECNALIEHQRQPIEQLGNKGRDITSAQIVFDSLLVSLKNQKREWDKFATAKSHPILTLPTGQGMIIKTNTNKCPKGQQ